MNQEQEALCVTNSHGRLLEANRRFCRMFGLEPEEVPWHYALDLHRNECDWLTFQQAMESQGRVDAYPLRLRHRKGRSFQCLVQSQRMMTKNGQVRYQTRIKKLVASESPVQVIPANGGQSLDDSLVYLTVCHACGKVKDSHGEWRDPPHPVRQTKHRKPCYCPECTAQLFPGLLDPENWEQPLAAVR